jgi:hypothetical protein
MAKQTTRAKQAEIDSAVEYLHQYLEVGRVIACVLVGYQECTATTNGVSRWKWQFLTAVNGERNNDTATQGHAIPYNITEKVAIVLGRRYWQTDHAPNGVWTHKDVETDIYNLSVKLFGNGSALTVVKYC